MGPLPRAKDFMAKKLVTLSPEMGLHDAAVRLVRKQIASAPVVDAEGRYLGLFSEKSCMLALMEAVHAEIPSAEVDAYLEADAMTIEEDSSLLAIAGIFARTHHRSLTVLRQDKPVGVVSRRDVIKAVVRYLKAAPDRQARTLYLSALKADEEEPPQF